MLAEMIDSSQQWKQEETRTTLAELETWDERVLEVRRLQKVFDAVLSPTTHRNT